MLYLKIKWLTIYTFSWAGKVWITLPIWLGRNGLDYFIYLAGQEQFGLLYLFSRAGTVWVTLST